MLCYVKHVLNYFFYLLVFIFLTSWNCEPLALVLFLVAATIFWVWHRLKTLTLSGFDRSRSAVKLLFPRLAFKFVFLTWWFSFSSTMGSDTDVNLTLHLRWLDLLTVVVVVLNVSIVDLVGTTVFLTMAASCRLNANPCLLTEPGPVLIAGNFVLDFFSHLMREVLRQTLAVVPLELHNTQHITSNRGFPSFYVLQTSSPHIQTQHLHQNLFRSDHSNILFTV